jgi:Holliday junction resolvasome RuvABC endonuclease subunit
MTASPSPELVLAIHPFARGFAFALMETPLSPVDWGIKEIRGKQWNAHGFAAIQQLIRRSRPDVLVFKDYADAAVRRSKRVQRLRRSITGYAIAECLDIRRYTRAEIRACFEGVGASSRYEIAQAIAAAIHAFEHRLPRARKLWEPEDPRMYLFDAVALALTHYASSRPQDAVKG